MSRGGKTTKIHAVVDSLGYPVHVQLTSGNIHDVSMAQSVLEEVKVSGSIVMGDKAYGSKATREYIASRGGKYCIPPKDNDPNPCECDWWQYKERHLVECFFQRLKQFRRLATRYEKLASRFLGFVHLACIMVWMH